MDYNSLPNFYAALDAKYNVTNNELNSATYTNLFCSRELKRACILKLNLILMKAN